MKIIIGTKNSAKFNRYKTILSQMPNLEVLSLKDIHITLPIIPEDGMTAEENASKKARAYAKYTGLSTLSVDEALYIGGLSPEQQPGTNVRRYKGKELTDDEMLNLYLGIIKDIPPEKRTATWIFAICLVLPNGQEFSEKVELYEKLSEHPSLPIIPGYPLSSLIYSPVIGKIYRDFTPEEESKRLRPIYKKVSKIIQAAKCL
ncbi:MAG TPA: hypothetical protein DDW76_14680 [Cyanobacteria bacterium UBA11369]|nr:hypothetical protein [Cyanobacteria bacterium UBA11371]HBE17604.1 hypothetical protein [Cyanobacteria bacterium UBA11367]HBE36070.1 hypothetical protein [Cyanobacteria bacterium UBA11368]HBE50002.1 hypothetical protein [Cyanobacteria bacterium UBA11369]